MGLFGRNPIWMTTDVNKQNEALEAVYQVAVQGEKGRKKLEGICKNAPLVCVRCIAIYYNVEKDKKDKILNKDVTPTACMMRTVNCKWGIYYDFVLNNCKHSEVSVYLVNETKQKEQARKESLYKSKQEEKARRESLCDHYWMLEQADDPWNDHYHCKKCGATKSERRGG